MGRLVLRLRKIAALRYAEVMGNCCLTHQKRESTCCCDPENDETKPRTVDVLCHMRGDHEPDDDTGYQDPRSNKLWHSEQSESREGSYGRQVSNRKEGTQHPAGNPWLGILEDERN